jgi:RNA polymerase sigma-70 factor (ECF subfamily)
MNASFDGPDAQSDDALLRRYVDGDGQAAAALTARLVPRLLGFCNRMLRDLAEAEDVVQEAMLRLWKMAPDWQPGGAKLSSGWAH